MRINDWCCGIEISTSVVRFMESSTAPDCSVRVCDCLPMLCMCAINSCVVYCLLLAILKEGTKDM